MGVPFLMVCLYYPILADIAQLVEPRIVIPVVAGSIPVIRPIFLFILYFNLSIIYLGLNPGNVFIVLDIGIGIF